MCKYSYLKMCNNSCFHACIYSYLVQKYKMYLYNQMQMTTFLFVTLPMCIMPFIDMLLADCHSIAFLYPIPYKGFYCQVDNMQSFRLNGILEASSLTI